MRSRILVLGAMLACALSVSAQAQTFTILHTFTGPPDGANPYADLVQDPAGNLYGTTSAGGTSNLGTVFKVAPDGTETVLHSFTGGTTDGTGPYAGLVQDAAGNLYGTTGSGGTANFGTVFKLDATGTETLLHSFAGGPTDGANPQGGLLLDAAGNLYGTTYVGGANSCGTFNCGTVFKLDTAGNETVLYSFQGGNDGEEPTGYLIQDSSGNLYGITFIGGINGGGTVFKVDTTGHETVLHSFVRSPIDPGGEYPFGRVLRNTAGGLTGTTSYGGHRAGIVYGLDTTTGIEGVLYTFSGKDGSSPLGLIQDAAGNLYGTTQAGGANAFGVVFELDELDRRAVAVLYNFSQTDGSPHAGLVRDSAGNLYGSTANGGTSAFGVVFKLTPITAPAFSPPGGTYGSTQMVTISDSVGTVIYYTTDGSVPTTASTQYTGPIAVNVSETVNAIAAAQSGSSPVGTAAYAIGTPDFLLSATALTPTTISPGQSSTATVTAPGAYGFSGSVALTCSVQPAPALAPQCLITPSSITPGNSATLTVSTTPASPGALSRSGGSFFYAAWLPLIGMVVVGLGAAQRGKKKPPAVVVACILFAGLALTVACGGSSGGGTGSKGTPKGAYTITLTGTSGSLTHSTTTTVTVQ